ncbi:unnamed protein product [Sphagnum jensenii]|uniref:DYW domain-containing protein n=1 Tax=Sphagnum jensenii TaxID=128206 RepID=A0ABP0XE09_9BRYO
MSKRLLSPTKQPVITLDSSTYVRLLRRCIDMKDVVVGQQIHAHILQTRFKSDTYILNTLLVMYTKCAHLVDARQLFNNMSRRDTFTWNMMLTGYAKNGHADEAFRIYEQMQQQGKRDVVSWTALIVGLVENGCGEEALEIFSQMQEDVRVMNALVSMYARCGSLDEAQQVFDNMDIKDVVSWNALIVGYADHGQYAESFDDAQQLFDKMETKNVISWNTMIGGYAELGNSDQSFQAFHKMKQEGIKADIVTFISILSAVHSPAAVEQGRQLHRLIAQSGFDSDVRVGNALINMYVKCGSIKEARQMFDNMASHDAISWNTIIGGYAEHGASEEAFRQVFDSMANRNVISWTAMIGGFSKDGDGEEAFSVFNQMQQEGIVPNTITFISILKLCASTAALLAGKRVHAIINQAGLQADICVGNALVDMYAKCGSIVDAQKVFDKMHERDVVSWNAIITGYAQHGLGEDALQLYNQMQQEGLSPDSTTFVGVLSACSHAGLVYEGLQLFNSMCHDYSIIPTVEHYGCMVDLLGRAGLLNAAEGFIRSMPFEADASIWAAFLGACRIHSNVKLADHAAKILLRTETQNAAVYVQLSNIYAAAGLWDDVEKVRNSMKDRGVKKEPGRTWIELGDQTHSFMIEDRSHPQSEKIYAELDRLGKLIQTAGYVPDTRFVVHDVDEKLKEVALCYHSEKLAIAFGIINMPSGTPIRIIKNLRVCTDCHTFTKFISKITGREIVARDSRRFHHFKNGLCSCGDFW